MAKPKRPSLAEMMRDNVAAEVATAMIEPRQNGMVVPMVQPLSQAMTPLAVTPESKVGGRGVRRDKPHTTIYLDPVVRNAIKRAALDWNKKPHDLMLEGIDMMLVKYTGKAAKDHIT